MTTERLTMADFIDVLQCRYMALPSPAAEGVEKDFEWPLSRLLSCGSREGC